MLEDPGMSLTDTLGQLDLMLLLHYWPEESHTLVHACINPLLCKESLNVDILGAIDMF